MHGVCTRYVRLFHALLGMQGIQPRTLTAEAGSMGNDQVRGHHDNVLEEAKRGKESSHKVS